MKRWCPLAVEAATLLVVFLHLPTLSAQNEAGSLRVQSVVGDVNYALNNQAWQPLAKGTLLPRGSAICAGKDGAVDLVLEYNGTALRLLPNSTLHVAELVKQQAGPDVITETSLKLSSGSLVGSQRKLRRPSRFDIQIPNGTATVRGTEYVVNAGGAVTVLSGEVTVNYKMPGGRSVRATVTAGFTFDPATGEVVPTTPEYLQNVIADVDTVRNNAQVFKLADGRVVVQPTDNRMSPTRPLKGNNGLGNGNDPAPPGNPPNNNDGPGSGPGNPGKPR